jgi:osmotically-inducible protein OsmY
MKMIKKTGITRTKNSMMMKKIGRMRKKMNASRNKIKIKRQLKSKARRKSVNISVIVDLIFEKNTFRLIVEYFNI